MSAVNQADSKVITEYEGCPVCGNTFYRAGVCSKCGFDASEDYEHCKTLADILPDSMSVRARRIQHRIDRKRIISGSDGKAVASDGSEGLVTEDERKKIRQEIEKEILREEMERIRLEERERIRSEEADRIREEERVKEAQRQNIIQEQYQLEKETIKKKAEKKEKAHLTASHLKQHVLEVLGNKAALLSLISVGITALVLLYAISDARFLLFDENSRYMKDCRFQVAAVIAICLFYIVSQTVFLFLGDYLYTSAKDCTGNLYSVARGSFSVLGMTYLMAWTMLARFLCGNPGEYQVSVRDFWHLIDSVSYESYRDLFILLVIGLIGIVILSVVDYLLNRIYLTWAGDLFLKLAVFMALILLAVYFNIMPTTSYASLQSVIYNFAWSFGLFLLLIDQYGQLKWLEACETGNGISGNERIIHDYSTRKWYTRKFREENNRFINRKVFTENLRSATGNIRKEPVTYLIKPALAVMIYAFIIWALVQYRLVKLHGYTDSLWAEIAKGHWDTFTPPLRVLGMIPLILFITWFVRRMEKFELTVKNNWFTFETEQSKFKFLVSSAYEFVISFFPLMLEGFILVSDVPVWYFYVVTVIFCVGLVLSLPGKKKAA